MLQMTIEFQCREARKIPIFLVRGGKANGNRFIRPAIKTDGEDGLLIVTNARTTKTGGEKKR